MTAILVGGEKGGTGKSTISTNLAIMAAMMGKDILLLDADKQASSAKFIGKRNDKEIEPTPPCVQIRGKYLNKEIEDLKRRYETIIIDAGGQDSVELRSSMACPAVSKIFIPLRSSELDLETIRLMDELVYLAQSYNPNLQAFLLFNQAPTHHKITLLHDAHQTVKDLENIKPLPYSIGHRVSFQYATMESMSVVEFELDRVKSMPKYQMEKYNPKASKEICDIYKEVFQEDFTGEITKHFKCSHTHISIEA
jgi:chromosome partitioning protein